MSEILYRERVRVRRDERGVAYVTLARPDKYNAIDLDMLHALTEAAKALRKDRTLRAVIFSGEGKSFCAGLDFGKVLKSPAGILRAFIPGLRATNVFQRACWAYRELPVPVINVSHGHCFGGGMQMALAADFRFTTPDCQLSVLEVKWGLIPDMSGSMGLRNQVGLDMAKLLTMTGRVLSGDDAKAIGLVTEVADDPMAAAEALVDELLVRSPDALAGAKQLFATAWQSSEEVAFSAERRIQARILMAPNQRRALKAATNKEAPQFLPRRLR